MCPTSVSEFDWNVAFSPVIDFYPLVHFELSCLLQISSVIKTIELAFLTNRFVLAG